MPRLSYFNLGYQGQGDSQETVGKSAQGLEEHAYSTLKAHVRNQTQDHLLWGDSANQWTTMLAHINYLHLNSTTCRNLSWYFKLWKNRKSQGRRKLSNLIFLFKCECCINITKAEGTPSRYQSAAVTAFQTQVNTQPLAKDMTPDNFKHF